MVTLCTGFSLLSPFVEPMLNRPAGISANSIEYLFLYVDDWPVCCRCAGSRLSCRLACCIDDRFAVDSGANNASEASKHKASIRNERNRIKEEIRLMGKHSFNS